MDDVPPGGEIVNYCFRSRGRAGRLGEDVDVRVHNAWIMESYDQEAGIRITYICPPFKIWLRNSVNMAPNQIAGTV